jgi:hypothetical protein
MPRRRVWDVKSMTDEELRALIHRCDVMERNLTGGYSKGRRGWTRLRSEAVDKLARRAPEGQR